MRSKILFVLHMPPPIHGAAMIGKYIHDSNLINGTFECHYINLSTAKNLDDIGKFGLRKTIIFILLIFKIIYAFIKIKPNLVYVTPSAGGKAFIKDFIIVQILKIFGGDIVVHFHNKGVLNYQKNMFYNFFYRCFFFRLKVILLANSLYDDIKKYVKTESVYICPNGIPFNSQEVKYLDENRGVPVFLFLSNLIVSKGVIVLLDACKQLKENGILFLCYVIGKETKELNKEQFEQEIKIRRLNNIVKYEGAKYGKEKEIYFQQSDIFIFPTFYHNECFPLVLLEAMSYALPCISTNEGAISEIIENGKTGFIVPKYDSFALADKMKFLIINQNERYKMGLAAQIKYKTEYTYSVFERNFINVVKNIIDTK
jgi:glycosyltransferase involved in cell wall biosynthesis